MPTNWTSFSTNAFFLCQSNSGSHVNLIVVYCSFPWSVRVLQSYLSWHFFVFTFIFSMSLLKGQLICRVLFSMRLNPMNLITLKHSWEECNSQCVLSASLHRVYDVGMFYQWYYLYSELDKDNVWQVPVL